MHTCGTPPAERLSDVTIPVLLPITRRPARWPTSLARRHVARLPCGRGVHLARHHANANTAVGSSEHRLEPEPQLALQPSFRSNERDVPAGVLRAHDLPD